MGKKYDVSAKIGLEGQAEFKKAVSESAARVKTLGTEMKAVTSAFDKNDKSEKNLTAQNKVLTKQISEQKAHLEILKKALADSVSKYGENSLATQEWQQKINRATAELNKMERQLDQNDQAMKKSNNHFAEFGNAVKKVGATVGKAFVVGLAAAGAAIVKIGKDAIEAFSDYEQLVGGVETLFGSSASTVIKNATNAFKTAGLSTNEYMETVTAFSASLLQSLEGDTEEAAKKADMAITDMADNANKMGTSIDSIQNAYQGFAKQNYTMLDNLKLGYGGTKEEMQRLLEDAQKISGIKYDISSYSDIVDAIHVVQTEMGITGTTAKEASSTIQGSFSAMKSAWKNVLTGLTRR